MKIIDAKIGLEYNCKHEIIHEWLYVYKYEFCQENVNFLRVHCNVGGKLLSFSVRNKECESIVEVGYTHS